MTKLNCLVCAVTLADAPTRPALVQHFRCPSCGRVYYAALGQPVLCGWPDAHLFTVRQAPTWKGMHGPRE